MSPYTMTPQSGPNQAPAPAGSPNQAPASVAQEPKEPTSRFQKMIDEANDPSVPLVIGKEPRIPDTAEAGTEALPMDRAAAPAEQAPALTTSEPGANQPSTGSRFKDWLRDANSSEVPVILAKRRGLSDAALNGAGVTAAPEIKAHRLGAETPAETH